MPRRMVITNEIYLIGKIWMPSVICAQDKHVSEAEIDQMRDDNGVITRGSMLEWLGMNTGDFQEIIDFKADFGSIDFILDWEKEESELTYLDCTYPTEMKG